jgi:hypothetical protein
MADQPPSPAEEFQPAKHQRERPDDCVNRPRQWSTGHLARYLGGPPRCAGARHYDVLEPSGSAAATHPRLGYAVTSALNSGSTHAN